MTEAILLLAAEIAVIVVGRSALWNRLMRLIVEGRVSTESARRVAASLIRTSGHLWLLLGFVPAAVLVMVFVSADQLGAATADLLAVGALGLVAWCGWKAIHCYRWAWRVSRL
jgi:3-methyladenine DNA glycosylase/8-oxoguanine DNA glycosylase